ncbi:MAG: hypothetical protein ACI97A_002394 [Planctomycetota bacterium]|jgi:hypothetical protein
MICGLNTKDRTIDPLVILLLWQNLSIMILRELTCCKAITTVLLLLTLASCASKAESEISGDLPLSSAMGHVGMVRLAIEPPKSRGILVVMKDRHSTRPGNHRVRPQLRQVQKDNRRLVQYLVKQGFDLLGCEQVYGEFSETKATAAQYRLLRKRVQWENDLDEFGIYQPILFQILWGKRLAVWGIEDPELFAADLEDFKTFVQARQQARRNDLSPGQKAKYQETLLLTRKKLRLNIVERGKAAAQNFLKLAEEKKSTRAILMVGGAHVPAAIEVLKDSGFNVYVFESSRYAREEDTTPPADD